MTTITSLQCLLTQFAKVSCSVVEALLFCLSQIVCIIAAIGQSVTAIAVSSITSVRAKSGADLFSFVVKALLAFVLRNLVLQNAIITFRVVKKTCTATQSANEKFTLYFTIKHALLINFKIFCYDMYLLLKV